MPISFEDTELAKLNTTSFFKNRTDVVRFVDDALKTLDENSGICVLTTTIQKCRAGSGGFYAFSITGTRSDAMSILNCLERRRGI